MFEKWLIIFVMITRTTDHQIRQDNLKRHYSHVKPITRQYHIELIKSQDDRCAWSNQRINPTNSTVLECGSCVLVNELKERASFCDRQNVRFNCRSCNQEIICYPKTLSINSDDVFLATSIIALSYIPLILSKAASLTTMIPPFSLIMLFKFMNNKYNH